MKKDVKSEVNAVLTEYLETNNCRKTPERYAILDAVYEAGDYFTMEDVVTKLAEKNFHVSRGTLFNTLRLFIELRLIIRHKFQNITRYEACYATDSHCHQICTICGKVFELDIPEIADIIAKVKLRRFRKDRYSLYVYGVCATCQHRSKQSKRGTSKERTK